MDFSVYKETIEKRLSKNFDIEENYKYEGTNFDLFAKFNVRNEKYFATKKATIYGFENNEYVFLKKFENFDETSLEQFVKVLKKCVDVYVDPHHEHMSTTITGIAVVNNINDDNPIKDIKKFNHQKSFMFGLKGWVDIRLVLVSLQDRKVVTSKKAKEVGKFYQP